MIVQLNRLIVCSTTDNTPHSDSQQQPTHRELRERGTRHPAVQHRGRGLELHRITAGPPYQVCVNSQLFSDSCAFTLFMSSVQCSSILKSSARISDIPAVTGDTAETLQWTAVARSHYCSRHTDHCTAALQLQTVTYNT